MHEADVKDFKKFLKEFQSETDRGAALVGAAIIDHRLTDTLRSFMVSNKAASTLLDGATAALGTFSSRIDATFALGLISAHEYGECHAIRKVRNEFAHSKHGTTFKDPDVKRLCDKLQSDLPGGRKKFADDPRSIFVTAVILVALALTYRADWVAKERRVTRTWPYE